MTRPTIAVEAVTTREAIDDLAEAWDGLLAAIGSASPFSTLDWIRCCLEYDPSSPPHILVAREGGTVTGIAPLWRQTKTYRGITARSLAFIGSSETAEVDFIVHPASREETLRALAEYLYRASPAPWDVVVLGQWPAESPNAQAFLRLLRSSGSAYLTGVSSIVPYIPIAGDWEGFWQSRTYLFRKSRRGILNRFKRLGEAEILSLEGDQAEEALRLYLDVSNRGWKQAEGLSVAGRPELQRFFTCLTRTAARLGWLRVWVLKIGAQAVAAEYHLASGGRVHALRADYDEAHAAHSPGAYLEYHILQRLFTEGFREYSTGPGRDDYKRRWTEHERTNLSVTLCRNTGIGLGVWLLEGVLAPAFRRGRAFLGSVRGKTHE